MTEESESSSTNWLLFNISTTLGDIIAIFQWYFELFSIRTFNDDLFSKPVVLAAYALFIYRFRRHLVKIRQRRNKCSSILQPPEEAHTLHGGGTSDKPTFYCTTSYRLVVLHASFIFYYSYSYYYLIIIHLLLLSKKK